MGGFGSPLSKKQKRVRNKLIYPLLEAEIGQTFNLPDYVPETNEQLLAAFEEANQVAAMGATPDNREATQRLISGDMGYGVDPAVREQYFQSLLGPAQIEFQDQLRNVAELYSGGYGGRSGDFQGGLAQATSRYGADQTALLAGLINEDEIRKWEAGQNALQRLPMGIQSDVYNQTIPLNTLMNSGMTQYDLDSQLMQQQSQQQMYAENPLMNPNVQQWVPWFSQPYKVPISGGDSGGIGGMLGGIGGSLIGAALGPFGSMLGGAGGRLF